VSVNDSYSISNHSRKLRKGSEFVSLHPKPSILPQNPIIRHRNFKYKLPKNRSISPEIFSLLKPSGGLLMTKEASEKAQKLNQEHAKIRKIRYNV
jgi:hypothetical protein